MTRRIRLSGLMAAAAAVAVASGWASPSPVQAVGGTRTVINGIAFETPVAPQVVIPPETAIAAQHLAEQCHVSVDGICVSPPPAAQTAPGTSNDCISAPSDYDCTGFDPESGGCSGDASTVKDSYYKNNSTDEYGYTELRWSGKCQSNWSRYTGQHVSCCQNYPVDMFAYSGYGGGDDSRSEGYWQSSSNTTDSVYGDMLWGGANAPNCVAADGYSEHSDGSHYLQQTTDCV